MRASIVAPNWNPCVLEIVVIDQTGLRQLQERSFLGALLGRLVAKQAELAEANGKRVPVLVKLAPDLDPDQLRTAVDCVVESGLDGIIATNTTISRDVVEGHPLASEEGGLSGASLTEMSTRIIAAIAEHLDGAMPIIGVGGIMSPDDARAKLDAGATLVQVYTGMIYEGPGLVKRILKAI